jgi:HAD superfamily hydrolase (TIGR01490 family)
VVAVELNKSRNAGFLADYKAGTLDIHAFLEFQLKPLAEHDASRLLAWRERFIAEKIVPMLLPDAKAVVDRRLAAGDLVAVVTATNSFVTRPIAELYGISHLIATELETIDGRFTGRAMGEPCFRAGKLSRVKQWLRTMDRDLGEFTESWFYSDSHNDLPLFVGDASGRRRPGPAVARARQLRGWRVMTCAKVGNEGSVQ